MNRIIKSAILMLAPIIVRAGLRALRQALRRKP